MLIAPEFLTTFTTKKMFGTRENVAILKALAWEETEWGLPQTILADMGGIVIDFSNIEDQDVHNEKSGSEKSPESRPNHEIPTLSQEVPLQREDTMIYIQEAQNSSPEVSRSSQEVIRSPREIESQPFRQRSKAYFVTEFERKQSRWFGGCGIPWKRHEPHVRMAVKVKEALELELHEDLPYWKV